MNKKLLFICLALVIVAGCVKTISSTGQPHYVLDPNTGVVVQTNLDAVAAATTATSLIFPGLLGFAAIAGWAAGLWRKLNPVLSAAVDEAQKYYNSTKEITTGVQAFKENPAITPTSTDTLAQELKIATSPETKAIVAEIKAEI